MPRQAPRLPCAEVALAWPSASGTVLDFHEGFVGWGRVGSTGTMVTGIVHPFGNVRSGLGISSRSITGSVEHTDSLGLLLNVYVGEVFMHGLQHLERVVQRSTVSLENVFTRIPTEALVGWSTRRLPASAQTLNRLVPLPWRTAEIRSSWWLVGCWAFQVTVL